MLNFNNLNLIDILARVFILLLVMPVHEFSHAAMAVRLGDDTPIRQGRYTLNPIAHLSLIGSFALLFLGFGWAKPVLVNPQNLKSPKRDMAIISIMGPVANILAALVLIIALRILIGVYSPDWLGGSFPFIQFAVMFSSANAEMGLHGGFLTLAQILIFMIQINLLLAAFNLLPIPPLDGSKVLGAFLPNSFYRSMYRYQGVLTVVLLLLLFTGQLWGVIGSMISWMSGVLWRLTLPINFLFG